MSPYSRPWPALFAFGLAVAVGCHPAHRPVPFDPPTPRVLYPANESGGLPAQPGGSGFDGMRRPRNVLALSGGGMYGAYSAGIVSGWSAAGTRPEFDVVTGISTGALMAPFVFLGPAFDARPRELYTSIRAQDVFRIRAYALVPFKDAIASSVPLRELIEREITPDTMKLVAAEHAKGRRLFIATTNLDARRTVIWDMGAVASRPCPEGCHLFRDILLASCSVPGMLPPVRLKVEVDGQKYTELHVDGGASTQIFMPNEVYTAAAAREPGEAPATVWVISAGKLYSDAAAVRRKVLPILGATTGSILYAHTRIEVANLYELARVNGMNFHVAALKQDFVVDEGSSFAFDQEQGTKLFQEGLRQGLQGPAGWADVPPGVTPGNGEPVRGGVKLTARPPG